LCFFLIRSAQHNKVQLRDTNHLKHDFWSLILFVLKTVISIEIVCVLWNLLFSKFTVSLNDCGSLQYINCNMSWKWRKRE
jgi:hypothetical protein